MLLRQGDTSFEGVGEVGGLAVEKLRFGRTTYSVADDGFAYRLDTRFVSIDGPIVASFDHHGPKTIPAVAASEAAPLANFPGVYDSLLGTK